MNSSRLKEIIHQISRLNVELIDAHFEHKHETAVADSFSAGYHMLIATMEILEPLIDDPNLEVDRG